MHDFCVILSSLKHETEWVINTHKRLDAQESFNFIGIGYRKSPNIRDMLYQTSTAKNSAHVFGKRQGDWLIITTYDSDPDKVGAWLPIKVKGCVAIFPYTVAGSNNAEENSVMREFFFLNVASYQTQLAYRGIEPPSFDTWELWQRSRDEQVPMYQYHDWAKDVIDEIANVGVEAEPESGWGTGCKQQ